MQRLTSQSSSDPSSTSSVFTFEISSSSSTLPPQQISYSIDNIFLNSANSTRNGKKLIKITTTPSFQINAKLLDALATFLSGLKNSGYAKHILSLNTFALPRCAWSHGLEEQIGSENWKNLLAVFDLDVEKYYQSQLVATSSPSSSTPPPLQNGISIFSICQEQKCLDLNSAIGELFMWEVSRRLRLCSDSNEVKMEFFGNHQQNHLKDNHPNNTKPQQQLNSSEVLLSTTSQQELREKIAPQIFEIKPNVVSCSVSVAADLVGEEDEYDDDDEEEDGDE